MSTASFVALGVPDHVADRLSRRGITAPFPIQSACLPEAMAGRDVSGRAPTGSGKTLAFGVPLVTRVGRAESRRPRGLVLVPTRELASQVRDELVALAGTKGPSVLAIFGGVGFEPQIRGLRRGADIVVACPGRLADLVERGDAILDEVEIVVLDEADRMSDMGFLPQVTRLLDRARDDRQTLLFSATLDGAVDVLVTRYQRDPVRHESAPEVDSPPSRHVFFSVDRSDRARLTAEIVGAEWPAIVFCRTKHGADRLARQLSQRGVTTAPIHGNRSQGQRQRALGAFVEGKVQALVATDVAARGIHVDDVACVVHFDPPTDGKDYVHRSGRTGRAGAAGVIVSLVDDEQAPATSRLQAGLGLPVALLAPDLDALVDERHAIALTPATVTGADGSNRTRTGRRGSGRRGARRGEAGRGEAGRGGSARRGTGSGSAGRGDRTERSSEDQDVHASRRRAPRSRRSRRRADR